VNDWRCDGSNEEEDGRDEEQERPNVVEKAGVCHGN
jgi:hypothetical protein